jgi:hypothetical protein
MPLVQTSMDTKSKQSKKMSQLWTQTIERKRGENHMNEQELRKIIEESEILAPYIRTMPSMPQYRLDSQQAIERYKSDLVTVEQDNFSASVYQCAFDIAMWVSGVGGSFSSLQCMTPEAHKNTFSNHNFAHLHTIAQEIRQEIEKLKNAKLPLSKLIDANAKAQWESCFMITLGTTNKSSSWSEPDWEKHETKIRSKEAVLDMAIILNEKLVAVYDSEMADRKKSPKIKEIVKNMSSLVKKADKIRPTITKANEKAQKALAHGTKTDLKTCKAYIDATIELSDLCQQYLTLENQLRFYTNEAINGLDFPALTASDTSAEYEIKKEWRRCA